MQIIAINKSRNPNQIWLKFDDNSLLPLKIDDLIVLNLKKFTPVSQVDYENILRKSAGFIITEYTLRQIAISPKTQKILAQKLFNYCNIIHQKYNFPPELLSQLTSTVLDDVVSRGLVDNSAFVDSYVRRHPKMSQVELKYNLQKLGIVNPLSIQSLSDTDKIRQIITKKYKNINLSDFKTKNKIIASLYRKGFAINDIKTVIDGWCH